MRASWGEHFRTAADVQFQVQIRHQSQVVEKLGLTQSLRQMAGVSPDPAEKAVSGKAFQPAPELRSSQFQVPDDTRNERFAFRQVQQPLVIFPHGLASITTVPATPSGSTIFRNRGGNVGR